MRINSAVTISSHYARRVSGKNLNLLQGYLNREDHKIKTLSKAVSTEVITCKNTRDCACTRVGMVPHICIPHEGTPRPQMIQTRIPSVTSNRSEEDFNMEGESRGHWGMRWLSTTGSHPRRRQAPRPSTDIGRKILEHKVTYYFTFYYFSRIIFVIFLH